MAMTAEQAVEAIYEYAGERIAAGASRAEVEADLVRKGIPADIARIVVDKLEAVRSQLPVAARAPGRDMLVGAVICTIGLVVTVGSYAAASGGGHYVLAWGAIVFGAIRFFRGLAAQSS